MLTRIEFQFPQAPKIEKLTENEKKLLQYVEDIKKSVAEAFRTMNRPNALVIDENAVGSKTGTGSTFVMSASPTIDNPLITGNLEVGSGNSRNDSEVRLKNYATDTFAWNMSVRQDIGGANNDWKLVRFNSSGVFQGIALQVDQGGGYLRAVDGDSTTPAYSFANSTNSGMYLSSAGIVEFAASGSAVFSYANVGLTMASGAYLKCAAASVGNASIRLPHGSAPSIPVDGDMWTTTAGLYVRINGSTVGPLS